MKITRLVQAQLSSTTNCSIKKALASLHQTNHLNITTYGHLLQHCTNHNLIRQGKQIHARILQSSITPDNFLASKLLTFYSKSNHLFQARILFDEIPHKNIFSWNAILIAYSSHNDHVETLKLFFSLVSSSTLKPNDFTITCLLKGLSSLFPGLILAKEIHGYVLRNGYECDLFVVNALVMYYARSDGLGLARKLFDDMSKRDIVSWNSMIAGYSQGGYYEECLGLYKEMASSGGLRPNGVTVVSVLQACAHLRDLLLGTEVHSFVTANNIEVDLAISNSIISLYAKCGSLDYARKLFEEMKERDEVSYGSLISGYMVHGFVNEALEFFREMKKPVLSTWNAVVSGLVHNNYHTEIPGLLREMQAMGFKPNSVTLSSVLPTFSYFSNLKLGKEIHCYAFRNNFDRNIYVATGIIDTYSKAGFVHGAYKVFMQCGSKSVITWTAIISAYAAHGAADVALTLFNKMLNRGTKPDPVTFTAVLSACAHSGIVEEAQEIFGSMLPLYGIIPSVEHYACMVGVLSRVGRLNEAAELISKMPVEPTAKVWGSLLNGASVAGDVELGEFICGRLFEIEPENTGNYTILANLYSRAGRWVEADMVREKMKSVGLRKTPGCSWIETSCGLQNFTAGDVSNQRIDDIYVVLELLVEMMTKEADVSPAELVEESICH